MSKQVWICDKCGRLVATQEEAESCEKTHRPIVSTEAIFWCQEWFERPFPKRIKVKVDIKNQYDYATYELVKIGPRGA